MDRFIGSSAHRAIDPLVIGDGRFARLDIPFEIFDWQLGTADLGVGNSIHPLN
jgi:hypothetical protein